MTALCEVFIVTALFIAALRGLHYVSWGPLHDYSSIIFLALALYLPLLMLRRRRRIDFLETSVGEVTRSIVTFLVAAVVIFPPYLLLAHAWQLTVNGFEFQAPLQVWPGWETISGQLFLIALPEEFFYRGYVQSTLDTVWRARWRICGTRLGWSWVVTALIFAASHSMIAYHWWHFAIFFPALAFGYLRARTGGLVAPTLFHATSNLLMWWLSANYA